MPSRRCASPRSSDGGPRHLSIKELFAANLGPDKQAAEESADDILVVRLLATLTEESALRSNWQVSCQISEEHLIEVIAERLGRSRCAFEVRLCAATAPLGHDENRLYPDGGSLEQRIWQATFSAAGAERIGQAGSGLMLSRTQPRSADLPWQTLPEIQHPIVDAYLANLPAGVAPRILGSRSLFVADTREEALKYAEIGLNRVLDRFIANGHHVPDRSLQALIRSFDVHVGTPDDVIASLTADSVLERATDVVFQVHSVDPPHALILRSLELTAQHVAPALGRTGGQTSPAAQDRWRAAMSEDGSLSGHRQDRS